MECILTDVCPIAWMHVVDMRRYNPEQGTVPMGTAVKITRDQMVQLKKVLREEVRTLVVDASA
mgnify:CR=1 FL=1